MPVIRFTKLLDKVLSQEKTRTIRKKRKCNCGASILDLYTMNLKKDGKVRYKREECICQIKTGNTLQIYIMLKLGEAEVKNVKILDYLLDLTTEDAILDGFENEWEASNLLEEMHGSDNDFRIIDFEPNWKPLQIVDLNELKLIIRDLKIAKESLNTYPRSKLDKIHKSLIKLTKKE